MGRPLADSIIKQAFTLVPIARNPLCDTTEPMTVDMVIKIIDGIDKAILRDNETD